MLTSKTLLGILKPPTCYYTINSCLPILKYISSSVYISPSLSLPLLFLISLISLTLRLTYFMILPEISWKTETSISLLPLNNSEIKTNKISINLNPSGKWRLDVRFYSDLSCSRIKANTILHIDLDNLLFRAIKDRFNPIKTIITNRNNLSKHSYL